MPLTTGVLNSHNRICLSEVSDESRVIGHTNDVILSSAHTPKEAVYQATKMKGGCYSLPRNRHKISYYRRSERNEMIMCFIMLAQGTEDPPPGS